MSRIPAGVYRADEVRSEKDGTPAVLKLRDVPGHSGIYQHIGNSPGDSKGCTLVGESRGSGPDYISSSGSMLKKMHKLIDSVKSSDAKEKQTTRIFAIYVDPLQTCSTYSARAECQFLNSNKRAHGDPQKR